ncbi:NusG domain II-containing protein [Mycoplasmatota bacterium]|nr:NusG domain II-containing protein [Mycoplasmatota bacterium]
MKDKKTMQKRDLYMIGILLVFFAALFLMFQYVWYAGDATYAYVYYGLDDPIVSIDFSKDEVERHFDQTVPEDIDIAYPVIAENDDNGYIEITLLGDFDIDGIRQVVIIQVDFEQNRVRVVEEQSPLNVCSKQGWSTAVPLICLPNRVRVEFDTNTSDIDIIQ